MVFSLPRLPPRTVPVQSSAEEYIKNREYTTGEAKRQDNYRSASTRPQENERLEACIPIML